MTNARISVAKYSNDRHLIWHEARTSLKTEIIRSLGPTLASTIGPPPVGFTTTTVPQIVAAVKGFYGTVDQMALIKMEDILAGPLDSVGNLDRHLANMRQHMLICRRLLVIPLKSTECPDLPKVGAGSPLYRGNPCRLRPRKP
jgi:hypothetical protein